MRTSRPGTSTVSARHVPSRLSFVDELSHQYVLSYSPTNDKRDGTWRALTVEVPGRDVRIRARQGYRATGTKP